MSLDVSLLVAAEDLIVGRKQGARPYYRPNGPSRLCDGKRRMHDAVLDLIMRHASGEDGFRFMSLPGKFWTFESRLSMEYERRFDKRVYLTGFERDPSVIFSGTGYVPRCALSLELPLKPGFRKFYALGVEYFKTNRARWIRMDVNDALSLNNSFFHLSEPRPKKDWYGYDYGMERWLAKFCLWDAAWLDYYGPASCKIAEALTNLHWHCNPKFDCIPVGVTMLKGREFSGMKVKDRQRWLASVLSGSGKFHGIEFKTTDYFEYSDGKATMCNILGVILRRENSQETPK